jgi:hypothetical protein
MEFCEFEGRLVVVSKMMATICSPASRFTFPASERASCNQYNRQINNEKEKSIYTWSLRIEKRQLCYSCADGIAELLIVFGKCKSSKKSVLSDVTQESW